ncbi:MAG: restriction endonuclease subunit S [Candidatus Gracilibacteria bacterium]
MQYSVVNFKTVKFEGLRIDPDYFMPKFLLNEKVISSIKWQYLSDISMKITDFGAYSQNNIIEYLDNGECFFIRNQDIRDFFLEDEKIFIDRSVYDQLSLHLEEKDILVQRVGTLGKAGIVLKKDLPSTANQNLAQIKPNPELINPFYLITFLNSKFGESYFERFKTGNVQPWLNLQQIKGLKIPIFTLSFQEAIERIISKVFSTRENSKSSYMQAERLLLSEIGLLNWKPKHQLSFVKKYSDSVNAERFDAEYFQPKYEEIIAAVKNYKGGFDLIKGQFVQNKKTIHKIDDRVYKYIEIGCVNISDGKMEPMNLKGFELPANAKIKLQKDDVIVSKVRPYRGAIGIVDCDNYVGSGAFTVLRENGVVSKETLMLFLRLKPLLDFSLKFNTGTSYPTITDDDILNFPLPKISLKIQEQIKEKIVEMQLQKRKSLFMLEIAKQGVEMAIEKSEDEAMVWLKENLDKIES